MSKRGGGPALYEMLQGRGGARPVAHEHIHQPEPVIAPMAPLATGSGWLSPGRVVRMPVGFVLLAIAGAIVVVAASYGVGFKAGKRSAAAELDQLVAHGLAPADLLQSGTDPLNDQPPAADHIVDGKPGPAANPPRERPVDSDPRQPGMNYFILMHTDLAGANRFASFCRTNRLDAYVVRADNKNSFQVVVLPGYAAADRNTSEIKKLEDRIHEVTGKWQAQTRESLAYYPARYQPPKAKTGQP